MTRNNRLETTAVLAALVLSSMPLFAARGTADFTRYVATGDSASAGVSNTSLLIGHQQFSYPAVIALQAGAADFQQPLISEPGLPAELQLLSLSPVTILPKAASNGAPLNASLPRPYNNLSIPGAHVIDLITLTGTERVTSTPRLFAQFILRGQGTAAEQMVALQPTFISVWAGLNDVFSAVLGGSPTLLTPLAEFTRDYNILLDTLIAGAPNAGMITAGIADITVLPFATAIPPVIINPATGQPVLGPDGRPTFFFADLGGGTLGQLGPGSLVTLSAGPFLSTGYGIPPALAPAFPTLPNAGKPLPDSVVLTAAEVAAINTRGVEINAAIITAASARNIPVVNMQVLLGRVKTGINYGNITLSSAYLTGGVFSYDGFHPTDIGYTIIANEFIKKINTEYGTRIPLASLTRFFAGNAPRDGDNLYLYPGMPFEFTAAAWENLLSVSGVTLNPETSPASPDPRRGRSRGIRRP